MTFFVSDSLKEILGEEQLLEDSDKSIAVSKNSSIKIIFQCGEESFEHDVKSIRQNGKTLRAKIHTNDFVFEKIFFKKLNVSVIVIGSTSKKLKSYSFLKAKSKKGIIAVDLLIEL